MLFLAQIPTVKDVIAGGDAIQGWPIWLVILLIFFFVVITGVVVAIIVYRGLAKTQNDTNALLAKVLDKSNDNSSSFAGAIATLANSVTMHQAQALEKGKADAERDKAIALMAQGLTRQNELLGAGNELTKQLTKTFSDSVSDTSTAVGAVGEMIGGQIKDLDDKLTLIPQKVLEIFEPARSELVVKLDTLGPDVAKAIVPDIEHMFKDCLELAKENDALVKEVIEQRERAETAERELSLLKDPTPPPPGERVPIPVDFTPDAALPKASGE